MEVNILLYYYYCACFIVVFIVFTLQKFIKLHGTFQSLSLRVLTNLLVKKKEKKRRVNQSLGFFFTEVRDNRGYKPYFNCSKMEFSLLNTPEKFNTFKQGRIFYIRKGTTTKYLYPYIGSR